MRMRRLVVGAGLLLAAGCAGVPVPPTYTDWELRYTCERTGGWWRGGLIYEYCEYQAPSFQ